MSLHEIAWLKAALGFPEEACEHYRLAYEAKRRTPGDKRNWNWFSSTLHELGTIQAKLGKNEEAIESFHSAIQANRNIEDTPIRQQADVASLHALAHLYIELEAWAPAVETITLEIAVLRAPSLVARELYWRTYAYVELEQWELANASAHEALEIYQQIPVSSRDRLHFSQLLEELAGLARQRGERDVAAKLFREARTERRKMQ